MNSASEAVSFECPTGFSIEDAQSQLYFEDIDDNSELWLVRMPNDMDPTVLENQVISLKKHSEILEGIDDKYYECFTEKCAMPNLCLVLPHKEGKKLEEIKKPFKGSVLITDYVKMESNTVIKMEVEEKEPDKENTSVEQKSEDTSVKKKLKSHKSNREKNEELDISFNLNIDDNDQASSSQQISSKKSKKKKSKHSDSLKVEPMSDADEFPNCKSQMM